MTLVSLPAAAEILDGTERQVNELIDAGELVAVDIAVHRSHPGKSVGRDGKTYPRRKRRLKVTAESLRLFIQRRSTRQERPTRRRRKPERIIEFF